LNLKVITVLFISLNVIIYRFIKRRHFEITKFKQDEKTTKNKKTKMKAVVLLTRDKYLVSFGGQI